MEFDYRLKWLLKFVQWKYIYIIMILLLLCRHQILVEFVPVPLSATEVRLVEGITDLLSKEPFVVSKNVVEIGNKIW